MMNILHKTKKRDKRSGFTLVELLVAITLFSIAVSISVGGFVRALRTQRQLITLIAANSNASLSIEQIAREMRTGTDFRCAGNPCEAISFQNAYGENVEYYYALAEGSEDKGVLVRAVGNAPETVTADNVNIRHVYFFLTDNGTNPPRITISMGVSGVGSELNSSVTTIQTTVSSRSF